MHHQIIITSCLMLALATGCDMFPAPESTGTGTTSGTSGASGTGDAPAYDSTGPMCPPAPLPPTDAPNDECACDLDNPQCGLGLDCVPWEGGGRCLAKCFGENKEGGGYSTNCHHGQTEIGCVNPYGPGLGPMYCPACLTCDPVNPKSVTCQ